MEKILRIFVRKGAEESRTSNPMIIGECKAAVGTTIEKRRRAYNVGDAFEEPCVCVPVYVCKRAF